MLIADLLKHKGSAVVTIGPNQLVTELLALLELNHIGGVVVTENDAIVGIVSERDVVRRLGRHGANTLQAQVADLMTTPVISCSPADLVDAVASMMTERRIRHMPVVSEAQLLGIVTIGDVVAARIRALEQERVQLENYITQG